MVAIGVSYAIRDSFVVYRKAYVVQHTVCTINGQFIRTQRGTTWRSKRGRRSGEEHDGQDLNGRNCPGRISDTREDRRWSPGNREDGVFETEVSPAEERKNAREEQTERNVTARGTGAWSQIRALELFVYLGNILGSRARIFLIVFFVDFFFLLIFHSVLDAVSGDGLKYTGASASRVDNCAEFRFIIVGYVQIVRYPFRFVIILLRPEKTSVHVSRVHQ